MGTDASNIAVLNDKSKVASTKLVFLESAAIIRNQEQDLVVDCGERGVVQVFFNFLHQELGVAYHGTNTC